MLSFPDLVSSIVTSFAALVKQRPALANSIFISLVNWDPSSLSSATPLQIRSVEKAFRISLAHLLKSGHAGQSASSITEFLQKQNVRMMQAADSLRQAKAEAKRKQAALDEPAAPLSLPVASSSGEQNKRRRVEGAEAFTSASAASQDENPLAGFDVTTLPVSIVAELIISSLQVIPEQKLTEAIGEIRRILPTSAGGVPTAAEAAEEELADENEELRITTIGEDDTAAGEDEDMAGLEKFELPEPDLISDDSHLHMLFQVSIERICTGPKQQAEGVWAPMLVRLATRGTVGEEQKESIRAALFGLIQQNPGERYVTA